MNLRQNFYKIHDREENVSGMSIQVNFKVVEVCICVSGSGKYGKYTSLKSAYFLIKIDKKGKAGFQ